MLLSTSFYINNPLRTHKHELILCKKIWRMIYVPHVCIPLLWKYHVIVSYSLVKMSSERHLPMWVLTVEHILGIDSEGNLYMSDPVISTTSAGQKWKSLPSSPLPTSWNVSAQRRGLELMRTGVTP